MSLKETVIKLMCVVAMLCCFMQTASADWYDDIKPNSTWVEIKGEKFVADTFMGVPALYNENDNSYYHCGELVIRFYKEAYNLEIYPYTDDTPTSLTEGYKFVTTKRPKKVISFLFQKRCAAHHRIIGQLLRITVTVI